MTAYGLGTFLPVLVGRLDPSLPVCRALSRAQGSVPAWLLAIVKRLFHDKAWVGGGIAFVTGVEFLRLTFDPQIIHEARPGFAGFLMVAWWLEISIGFIFSVTAYSKSFRMALFGALRREPSRSDRVGIMLYGVLGPPLLACGVVGLGTRLVQVLTTLYAGT